ncbi:MAG: hypothetical protein LBG87_00235 [Spirochaetaceae bacterium]|jgi:hypothetical protein|nr:hypothetical protein [Spirochaetaceae bacterium]
MNAIFSKTPADLLVKRTVSFFFGICLLLVFLYGVGTMQGFMDITQLILLHWIMRIGILLGFTAGYGIILDGIRLFRRRFRYAGGFAAYALAGLFGFGLAVFGAFMAVLTGGNGV